MRNSKPVLLVEDDSVNAMAVIRVFDGLKVPKHVVHLENGEDALKYLSDNTLEKPDLILLDLDMPGMNGVEFLRIIKADTVLRNIPVVMFTTSDDQRDIDECFDLNVAGYIIKPFDPELFHEMVKTVATYWSYSELPKRQEKRKWYKILTSMR
jgi:CheY-like chemotaxis protein